MREIIPPTEKKVEGPWLLDLASLEDLDNCFNTIENRLDEAFQRSVEDELEKKSNDNYSTNGERIDQSKTKDAILNSYTYKRNKREVVISTSQGKKIKDSSLLSLIKEPQINELNPNRINVEFQKGPYEFTFELNSFDTGLIVTRVKGDDYEALNDINYEINKWLEKNKPKYFIRKWSKYITGIVFFSISAIFLFRPAFIKTKTELYKQELARETTAILKDGLSDKELTKSNELILKLNSNYLSPEFNPDLSSNNSINLYCFILGTILLLLLIKPITIIGIGKNKNKMKMYKSWIHFVSVFIPITIIVPILRSKIFK